MEVSFLSHETVFFLFLPVDTTVQTKAWPPSCQMISLKLKLSKPVCELMLSFGVSAEFQIWASESGNPNPQTVLGTRFLPLQGAECETPARSAELSPASRAREGLEIVYDLTLSHCVYYNPPPIQSKLLKARIFSYPFFLFWETPEQKSKRRKHCVCQPWKRFVSMPL